MFTSQYLLKLRIPVKACFCNNFHTSSICAGNPALPMRKLMGLNKKKKKIYMEPFLPSPGNIINRSEESKPSIDPKRARVLNKIFMRYITELMATGERAPEFLGHGIEISKIKITPNYKGLNVYWIARGNDLDCKIETLLKKHSGYLRHELSTLKVIGEIPKITFVKDTKYADIVEIDRRLTIADFGEDHEPVEVTSKLKSQLELHLPLDPETQNEIKKLDETHSEQVDDEEKPLPPMPQCVFGLNHDYIMKKVLRTIKKSHAAHRQSPNEVDIPKSINADVISYTSNKEQREAFREFLRKREIMRSKARRLDKSQINQLLNVHIYENTDVNEDIVEEDDEDYLIENEKEV